MAERIIFLGKRDVKVIFKPREICYNHSVSQFNAFTRPRKQINASAHSFPQRVSFETIISMRINNYIIYNDYLLNELSN